MEVTLFDCRCILDAGDRVISDILYTEIKLVSVCDRKGNSGCNRIATT